MAREKTRMKKKERKNIAAGVAHVNSSFNNTKILISDVQGNAISWSSSGTMGFKGSRKSTPYAAQMAAEDAAKKAQDHGVKTLEVEVQGPGSDGAQRLPPAKAPPRLTTFYFTGPRAIACGPVSAFLFLGRRLLKDMGRRLVWRRHA